MKFTEAKLEQAIIALLEERGYPHFKGEELARRPDEVLLRDDLGEFLARRYGGEGITPGEIDSICRRLERLPALDLYESRFLSKICG